MLKEKKTLKSSFTGPILENLNFSASDIQYENESSNNPSFSGIIKDGIEDNLNINLNINKLTSSPARSNENSFSYTKTNRSEVDGMRLSDTGFKQLAERQ